jgi:hypothetical protein
MKLLAWLLAAFARRRWLVWLACRYRRWFRAENSGSYKLKKALDQKALALHLSGRCLFCGREFEHGESGVCLPAHHRWYCFDCRDSIDAEERDEAEREARAGAYTTHGVTKKDFY